MTDHQKIATIAERAAAYGMPGETVDGNDVEAVHDAALRAVDRARAGGGPMLIECVTYRWRGHFEGDPQPYRTQEEVESWKGRDPLKRTEARLFETGLADRKTLDAIWEDIRRSVDVAVAYARQAPLPEPESALTDVYTDLVVEGWR